MAARLTKSYFLAAVAALTAVPMALLPLAADARGLSVPQVQVWTINTIRYECAGGKSLTVRYTNTQNQQNFALLNVQGHDMLFVNTLATTGTKYVAGKYSWWTRNLKGTLRDETAAESAAPLLDDCRARA